MMRRLLRVALAAMLGLALGSPASQAGPVPLPAKPLAAVKPAARAPATRSEAPLGEAREIAPTGRPIVLAAHKGVLVRLPHPASTIFIADPAVADVSVQSPSVLYIKAVNPGETALYALDANQRVLLSAPVRVVQDLGRLRRALRLLAPGDDIRLAAVGNTIVLTGAVASAAEAEKVRTLAAAIAGETKGSIINRLSVTTPNQVYLRVKVAEVNRNVLKALGIDWSRTAHNFQVGTVTRNVITGGVPNTLSLALGGGAARTEATLDALESEGLLTTLAEPNLTAVSGHPASFLAGGVFYIPVPQTAATGGGAVITQQQQPFGVQLQFTPTVIDADHVSLTVRPEVSDLAPPVSPGGPPSLTVRRAETTVELASGDSFALAGLLQNTVTQNISKVPWLGDIPILGQLFRSQQFQRNETELVIIVTVYLVKPSETRLATPADGFAAPASMQQAINGDLYQQRLPAAARGPLGPGGRGLIGPAGFQID